MIRKTLLQHLDQNPHDLVEELMRAAVALRHAVPKPSRRPVLVNGAAMSEPYPVHPNAVIAHNLERVARALCKHGWNSPTATCNTCGRERDPDWIRRLLHAEEVE